MRWRSNSVKSIRDTEQEPNSPPTSGSPIAKAIGCFTGVSVIKLMPFECFHNQNKRACTNKLSHITRSYRVRGFSFGGCRGIFPNASYPLMGLNKLFTIKWNPKRWNNALKPYFLKFLKDIKVGKACLHLIKTKLF